MTRSHSCAGTTHATRASQTLLCFTLVMTARSAASQERVPTVDLPPALAKTRETFGALLGVHELAGGKVLVNDAGRHQIKLFDSTLATFTMVSDSAPGSSTSYGNFSMPLIRYLGDSTLFPDFASKTLLILDARGTVARVLALPEAGVMNGLMFSQAGIDPKGRLVYRNNAITQISLRGNDPSQGSIRQPADSVSVLRADFDTRAIDTLGVVAQPNGGRLSLATPVEGRSSLKITFNPLQIYDEWAVLSDGTIAFVRGHDYHVDWLLPDGTRKSTPKLPFDWKRLTDDDKQKLVDSARTAEEARAAQRNSGPLGVLPGRGGDGGGGGGARGGAGRGGGDGAPAGARPAPPQVAYAPLNEIADYWPPIRRGAATADLDGNLWILPTTSAQSKGGELIYDVVTVKDGLVQRVRVPAGRSIAGFGKGGTIYLMSGDKTNGFVLEKSRLGAAKRAAR